MVALQLRLWLLITPLIAIEFEIVMTIFEANDLAVDLKQPLKQS